MADIKMAFWNLQNLFDTVPNEVFSDFEFTPAEGWDQQAYDAKIANLATVIRGMHNGTGPDLLGVAEIENEQVAAALLAKIGLPALRLASYKDSRDIRGIDVALFYSTNVFKSPPTSAQGHGIYMRYPTRDIFEVHLELKSGEELIVFVNHWPSRSRGHYETEPGRIMVAERCGNLIDTQLKVDRATFLGNPPPTLAALNDRWDRNVLAMGDFNDEPYDRSILDYLLAGKDLDHLEEPIKASGGSALPAAKTYLGREAYLAPDLADPAIARAASLGTHQGSIGNRTAMSAAGNAAPIGPSRRGRMTRSEAFADPIEIPRRGRDFESP